MSTEGDTTSTAVNKFIYTGQRIGEFPLKCTHLTVHSSVAKIGLFSTDEIPQGMELTSRGGEQIPISTFRELLRLPEADSIGGCYFTGLSLLVEVELQEGLRAIGAFAFEYCKNLREVSVPSTVETIGFRAFCNCTSLREIKLREGLKAIGQRAFQWCDSLRDIELREGLREIGELAFNCASLSIVRIPASTTRIGVMAFAVCKNLLGVEFTENARVVLEGGCFYACAALINVSVPSTLVEVEAFSACKSLLLEGVAENLEELEPILRGRFSSLPVHQLCYHSSTSRVVDLVNRIRDSTADEKNAGDIYGMTPFHVLATSATLRIDLLEVLLDEYPVDTLVQRDGNGFTIMDYLLTNESSSVFPPIDLILQRVLVERMERFGLERWEDKVSSEIERIESHEFQTSRECLDDVLVCLAHGAKVEMTSLLEVALWKRQIRSFIAADDNQKRRKVDCRTLSGADVVMPNVMAYLWNNSGSEGPIDVSMIPYDVSWLKTAEPEDF